MMEITETGIADDRSHCLAPAICQLAILDCLLPLSLISMPPRNKSNAAGVSSSSLFDLKAELAKQEEEFAKRKAAGKGNALVGGVKRPDKVSELH